MEMMTMPSVGLQMDFSKDIKAMVRSGENSKQSDFLKQMKSMVEGLEKQGTEVKKQTGSAKNENSETIAKSDEASEELDNAEGNSQENIATMAELARMFVLQETPVVVDVKEMLAHSEPSQNGENALGEILGAEFVGMGENGAIVELEQAKAENPLASQATEFQKEMQASLAGQQATNETSSSEASKANTQPVVNVQPIANAQPTTNAQPIANSLTPENSEKSPQTAETLIVNTSIPKQAETTNSTTMTNAQPIQSNEQASEVADEMVILNPKSENTAKTEFEASLKEAGAVVTQASKAVPNEQNANSNSSEQNNENGNNNLASTAKTEERKSTENNGETKELFVTDKLRKQMDKLEEMLSQGGMSTAQIKDFKTSEIAKVAQIENQDMAPQVQQVTAKIFEAMDNGTNELIMQLQPKELGKLMIKLSMENNKLTVNITAETLHGQKAIMDQLGLLESSMKSQNVVIDRINVAFDSSNNMNSSYNQSGLGGFNLSEQSKEQNGQNHSRYQDGFGNMETEETIPVPKLMIIGNDMLNYVV